MVELSRIERIRSLKFRALIDEYKTQEALADALGVTPGYVYQIKSEKRPITEKSARKFEKILRKPSGWFDASYDTDNTEINSDLAEIISLVNAGALSPDHIKTLRTIAEQFASTLQSAHEAGLFDGLTSDRKPKSS